MLAGVPDKLYFKIGEVAEIVSLRPSVLRFWETEFEILNPAKSRSGQRLYTNTDLEIIFEIKKLLYSEKLTIEGARKKINRIYISSKGKITSSLKIEDDTYTLIDEVKKDLYKIRKILT